MLRCWSSVIVLWLIRCRLSPAHDLPEMPLRRLAVLPVRTAGAKDD